MSYRYVTKKKQGPNMHAASMTPTELSDRPKFNRFDTYFIDKITWATSWENLFMPYVNNKGAVWSAPLLFTAEIV